MHGGTNRLRARQSDVAEASRGRWVQLLFCEGAIQPWCGGMSRAQVLSCASVIFCKPSRFLLSLFPVPFPLPLKVERKRLSSTPYNSLFWSMCNTQYSVRLCLSYFLHLISGPRCMLRDNCCFAKSLPFLQRPSRLGRALLSFPDVCRGSDRHVRLHGPGAGVEGRQAVGALGHSRLGGLRECRRVFLAIYCPNLAGGCYFCRGWVFTGQQTACVLLTTHMFPQTAVGGRCPSASNAWVGRVF